MKHLQSNRTGNFHTYQLSMPKYRKPTYIMTNFNLLVINWFTATYFHGFDEPMQMINNLRQTQGKFGLLAIKNIFDNKVLIINFAKFS